MNCHSLNFIFMCKKMRNALNTAQLSLSLSFSLFLSLFIDSWLESSIDDVVELLRNQHEACARANAAKLSLARVTFDTEASRWRTVSMCVIAANQQFAVAKSLRDFGFGVGDFIDVAILDA
jgi:hypothetical protein